MRHFGYRETLTPLLSLFLSTGTLLCCALPALFITLGLGAALGGLVSSFPQLVWLSAHKTLVFGSAAAMLVVAGVLQWRARNLPCPADPAQAKACLRMRRAGIYIYLFSVFVFLTGSFFAFVAPYVLL